MKESNSAKEVVANMLAKDNFSQWLGVKVLAANLGSCTIQMTIRKEMLNAFGTVHGGVTFAFADSALAFSSNSYGRISVALEVSMSYPVAVRLGDKLTAVAVEVSLTNKIGVYFITVTNQENHTVGVFKGTVYRTSKVLKYT